MTFTVAAMHTRIHKSPNTGTIWGGENLTSTSNSLLAPARTESLITYGRCPKRQVEEVYRINYLSLYINLEGEAIPETW